MRTKTTSEFIEESIKIHGDRYDYSKVIYQGSKTKVCIMCPKHGEFLQRPNDHLSGHGCPKCANELKENSYELFLSKAHTLFENKYTYVKPDKFSMDNEIEITCPKHGLFKRKPIYFLNKKKGGCPSCNQERFIQTNPKKKDFETFKEEAFKVHGDKFEFDGREFVNMSTPITFKCKVCGYVFKRKPSAHLTSQCKICSTKEEAIKRTKSCDEFIKQAKEIHGDDYDYTNTTYDKSNKKVLIKCNKCGRNFEIEANSHLSGHGCPFHFNNVSKMECELFDFVKSICPDAEQSTKNVIDKFELDIYIPSKKVAFEFDGLYWHNELNKTSSYHLDKTVECEKIGIRLFHVFEDEWIYKKDIIMSMINNILHNSYKRIYARNCSLQNVSSKECTTFLNKNHLQGACGSSIKLGLYYNSQLVSLMIFGKSRHFVGSGKHEYELLRFCNKLEYSVVGGASKLFKHFVKEYNPNEIVSYADRRWSNGNLYYKLGFELYNKSKPNYYYVINNNRVYRFNMRKSVLIEKYHCPVDMTEKEFCFRQKWYRIYDCGCLCFIWKQRK